MARVSIASVQPPFLEEPSAAHSEHVVSGGFRLLEEALRKGVAFACLPEYFNVFGAPAADMASAAHNHQTVLDHVRAMARRYSAHVIVSLLVPDGGRFFNRAFLVADDGSVAGRYDKLHPTIAEREQFGIDPGPEAGVFVTRHGTVAIATCYDVYFPELFSAIARAHPDIVFLPSMQRSEHEIASEALVKVRAMDTQAFFVRSSYGREGTLPWRAGMMFGQSCIVHPDGTMLGNAGHHEGFAFAHVTMPFSWKRQRCGGYPPMAVREFLDADRRATRNLAMDAPLRHS